MEAIQNAYNGFAKQNYTMLDNLKLGYGGTKSEMERLLKDAEAISGVHYDIANYSDVVEAIHVIQDEMGVTGTTAREAAETISGSVGMMRGAWENWLAGLGNDETDMGDLTRRLVDSVVTAGANIAPRVVEIARSMAEAIPGVVMTALRELPKAVVGLVRECFGDDAAEGALEFVNRLHGIFAKISDAVAPAIRGVADRVSDFFDTVAHSGVVDVLTGVADALGMAFSDVLIGVVEGVAEGVGKLFDALSQVDLSPFQEMLDRIKTHLEELGPHLENISRLWGLFTSAVSELVMAVAPLVAEFLAQLGSAIVGLLPIVASIGEGFLEVATVVIDAVTFLVTDAQTGFEGLRAMISEKWEAIKSAVSEKVAAIKAKVTEAWNGIKSAVSGAVEGVRSKVTSTFEAVKRAVTTTWNGIRTAITTPINAARDAVKGAIDKIKGFFSFSVSWPHIPLPHFSVSPAGWSVGDLLKGSIPSLGISWYAKGGIIDEPTIRAVGVGERGPELVWPRYEPYLSRSAGAIAGAMGGSGGVTNNYYIDGSLAAVDARLAAALEVVAERAGSARRMGTARR